MIMKLDSNQIQAIIPHRYPFLLVDRIEDMEEGKWAKGIKCVTANEAYFAGHFADKHIMPGVLILEALAQTGAIALLSEERFRGKIPVFGGVKNCRFKEPVLPGDILELFCELKAVRGGAGFGSAIARVNGKTAVEAEISFGIMTVESR